MLSTAAWMAAFTLGSCSVASFSSSSERVAGDVLPVGALHDVEEGCRMAALLERPANLSGSG
jgi:hypothetical protein